MSYPGAWSSSFHVMVRTSGFTKAILLAGALALASLLLYTKSTITDHLASYTVGVHGQQSSHKDDSQSSDSSKCPTNPKPNLLLSAINPRQYRTSLRPLPLLVLLPQYALIQVRARPALRPRSHLPAQPILHAALQQRLATRLRRMERTAYRTMLGT